MTHHQPVEPSVCDPYHLSAPTPVRLLIMSDLDSLLVELESSIERRVTSSSTCTRVTVETGCEDTTTTTTTTSLTRQHPRSDC